MILHAGTIIGKYTVLRQLGAGGMGAVYAANQDGLGRRVAIKVMLPGLALDPRSLRDAEVRFEREARTLAQLSDPHVVQVFDFGRHELHGQPFLYMCMEYVDGGSWADLMDGDRQFAAADHLEIARQSALGLAAAEEEKIYHRDVKPGNIMVTRKGVVKVVDFGLSVDHANYEVTGHQAKGTPPMMAPEVWEGRPSDQRTDIYALGVSLWQALTGKLPFTAAHLADWMRMHCQTPVPAPVGVSAPIAAVLQRMLAKRPEDRFQTHREVVDALARIGTTGDLRSQAKAWFADPIIDQTKLARSLPVVGSSRRVERRDRDGKGRRIVQLEEAIVIRVPLRDA